MKFPVRYDCENGTVILNKATISPRKGIRGDDVIIFAGGFRDRRLWERLKRTRDPTQLWVFNTDESPLTTMEYIPPRKYRSKINFNLTFTYHSRSAISIPYGQFTLFEKPHSSNESGVAEIDYHSLRPKFVAWISSHCSTISWDRTRFVKDLSYYLPIDKFGKCGDLECARKNQSCPEIFKQYKFILAFENSCCPEYITEKFWRTLRGTENVPVVIGANKEDYERLGPPNSFVYAGDFESMQSLADYLNKVAEDPKLYNSFFKWKSIGRIRESDFSDRRIVYRDSMCHLLEFVKKQRNSKENSAGEGWDLYDSSWLGGCKGCSNKEWIRKYNKSAGSRFTFN
ncbi:Alpha-(1,3)-fucosyltransferase C [Holothuria leucospilota]|uniref:Fucosyltransferase n=1 Tax=Holothuria leucospilota TaxID=206669 RepID=A0A9Q1HJI6_HOLLE|nr:Alpha-(1,3)-fucosyltransferase C [Holothuria leucospilota]